MASDRGSRTPTDSVWLDETGSTRTIVQIQRDGIRVAEVTQAVFDALGDVIRSGGPIGELAADDALVVPTDRLETITANEHGTQVTIFYKKPLLSAALTAAPFGTFDIACSSPESRDRLLDAARRALEPAFELSRSEHSRGRACLAPLGLLAAVAFASWAVASYAADAAAGRPMGYSGRYRWLMEGLYPWLGRVGPTAIAAVAALAGIGVLFWLMRRLSQPPVVLSLRRSRSGV